VLVLRFEGHTPQALSRIQSDMMALLHGVLPGAVTDEAAH
jgi:phosphomannomutase